MIVMGVTRTFTVLLAIYLVTLLQPVYGVDRSKFRTCQETGFCRRYRGKIGPIYGESYSLEKPGLTKEKGKLTAKIQSPVGFNQLNLMIAFYKTGSIRVKISGDKPRWQPLDLLMDKGMDLLDYSILSSNDKNLPESLKTLDPETYTAIQPLNTEESVSVLAVHKSPLKFELYCDGILQIAANERLMMHFEQNMNDAHRKLEDSVEDSEVVSEEDRHKGKEIADYGEDGLAIYTDGTKEERKLSDSKDQKTVDSDNILEDLKNARGDSFGGNHDSQPNGPQSVGIDFSFPFSQDVYGIPEHSSPLSLPTTLTGSTDNYYSQPYRLYNLDVFEYELDQSMALYGNIPLMLAHSIPTGGGRWEGKGMTSGVFWFNPTETFVDVNDFGPANSLYKQTHWISESGEIDFFLLPGPTFKKVYAQYTSLTGTQQLPPIFSLGYHQCRWNYRDEKDVAAVEAQFEALDYPMDVIWLDIEHTDGKRYFTWDKNLFPNPVEMQQNVSRHGRKMVTIVDPHLKRDDNYFIHKEATAKGLYIKKPDGKENYDGWCWPGSSSYLDFTNPRVREWWAQQFNPVKYIGSTLDLYTWNDMNEPSVFNGPEVSMPKDTLSLEGVEHREWHNLYGIYMQWATAMGLTERAANKDAALTQRPFVLTRAFWAGSQKHGAMWTGDNTAEWGHLKIAAPMLLSINLAGLSFAGADVGGFFGNPDAELFTRWYQAGAFTPFFRGHAHHDSKRREPWVFGDPYTSILRHAAMLRYSLLPFWYTVFYEGYATGMPVMRPLLLEFPDDVNTFKIDDQWMIGSGLLVKPIVESGRTVVDVYFPQADGPWFDLETLKSIPSSASSALEKKTVALKAPIEKIPVFIRPGSIIPRKMRLRRSASLMFYDPYTLIIAPNNKGEANGLLYLDDEKSLAHELTGGFILKSLKYVSGSLKCVTSPSIDIDPSHVASNGYTATNTVERVVILGQEKAPRGVKLAVGDEEKEIEFFYQATDNTITVKKPDCLVSDDWELKIEF